MAFHDWLQMVQLDFYRDGILSRVMVRINKSVCWWTMLKILFTGKHKLFNDLLISLQFLRHQEILRPVPVAARSKEWVCGRSLAVIVGSKRVAGVNACLL